MSNLKSIVKKRILLGVDHKWRDLPGSVYLKYLLEKKFGYKVKIVRNGLEYYFALFWKPDLIIYNHVYEKRRADEIKKLKQLNISIAVLPTEGIPTLSKIRDLAAGKFSILNDVDLHFVWNKKMYDIMVDNKIMEKEKIKIIGCPRFDFYHDPLKKLLLSRHEFYKKYGYKNLNFPLITIPTNFTNAGFYKKNMDFLRKDWKNLKVDKYLDPDEIARRDFESREIILDNIIKLIKEYDNLNFAIKPHPSEEHGYYSQLYENKLKKYNLQDRVKIIKKEYIWDLLNISSLLLKRSCTTGVEAWFLGLPTIELKLNPDEWYFSEEHASGSDVVSCYEELKSKVDYYLNNGQIPDYLVNSRESFISDWCYKNDGKSSIRFISEIHRFLKLKRSKTKNESIVKNIRIFLIYMLLKISNYKIHDFKLYGVKLFTGKKIDKLGRVDKYFNNNDVRHWIRMLKKVECELN